MRAQNYTTIDEYIAMFPEDVKEKLREIRGVVRETAPEATEKISYRIPTFYQNGNLVHFAAFKGHISFFPTSSGVTAFKKELKPYKTARGTIQFSLNEPLPLAIIKKIVAFRVKESRVLPHLLAGS